MPVAQTRFELLHLSVNRLLSAVQSTKIPNLWDSVGCEKVVNLFILKSKTLHQVKRLSLFLIFLLSSFSALAQQSILGRWNTGQENTVLEVKEVQGKIEGRIVASDHTKAPLGRLILKDVTKENGDIVKGSLYSLRKDKWFEATFAPQSKNMEVILTLGWVTRKFNWIKLR